MPDFDPINRTKRTSSFTGTNASLSSFTVLALDDASYAWAWGQGGQGKLGSGFAGNGLVPVSVLLGPIVKLTSNTQAIAALDASSYAWAWGVGSIGELGNSNNANQSSPVSVVGGRQWTSLVINDFSFLVLDSSSYAWAWGANGSGQIGDGTAGSSRSSPVSVLGGRRWSKSFGLSRVLDSNSYAWAWGANGVGQIGDGTVANQSSPVSVLGARRWQSLIMDLTTVNPFTTIGLDLSSYAWAWGRNTSGQLGNSLGGDQASPVSVLGAKQWLLITQCNDGSNTFVLGLDASSYAWGWGNNVTGQLGNNSTADSSSPLSVLGGRQWRSLILGTAAVVGIDASSYAWCWGFNSSGQLADLTTTNRSSPVSVVGGKQWASVYCRDNNVLALDNASTFWTWGLGTTGQAGNNTSVNNSSPVSVLRLNNPALPFGK